MNNEKKIMVLLFILTIFLTVRLAHTWQLLNTEQQAFVELAAYVDNQKNAGTRDIDTWSDKTVDTSGSMKEKKTEILPEYQELVLANPDFSGWIVIDGTAINYPIMQRPEEMEYYLHRDFNGQDSYAGTPFVGGGNLQEEGDLFIYGHNMKNGTMFADLLQYQQKVFWNAHPVIQLDNRYEHRKYRVVSVFYAEETELYGEGSLFNNTDLGGNMKRDELIETFQKRRMHENNVMLDSRTPLLFLITCSYWKEDGRLVVVAVQEKL